ncbi:MAG: FAD-dependent oxidoreductase [Candidatus Binatia bacterium]
MTTKDATRVVLAGAGHAHVLVLESWIADPPDGVALTVITDRPDATYSGMVPGFVAGDYRLDETAIAVEPLTRRAGARFVLGRARRIDPDRKILELEDGTTHGYDVASLDVGSSIRGLDLPGVREHALATRPIGDFAAGLERHVDELTRDGPARVAVVGAGAAGVELAFTLHARLEAARLRPDIVVVCGADGLLPGHSARVHRLVTREASARAITIAATTDATFVDERGVGFASGHLRADLVVWATGAAAPDFIAESALPHDPRGFVRVNTTLEVRGYRGLFAAGDCAAIEGKAWVPKSGVHAVRAAPVLDANLRAALTGLPLVEFRPQRNFLSLINLGNRRAIATKWGFAVAGRLAWHLKDRIDRAFLARFS